MSYYSFWRLDLEDQKELLGTTISFDDKTFTVVELDPVSRRYNEQYSLLNISKDFNRNLTKLWITTIDDSATIYYWKAVSFPSVWLFMEDYMKRTNYYVSIAAIFANRNYMGQFESNESY